MKIINTVNLNKKIIFINLIIFLFILLSPPTVLLLYRSSRNLLTKVKGHSTDPRANSNQYIDKKFSHQLFKEKDSLVMEYKSYIGWRPKVVNLKYTNIEKPYNTRFSIGQSLSNSTWFFGGSTMWGFGSSDKGTIPSIYARKNNSPVFNFGEQSWVSRQSLNQLISALGDGKKPEVVIFYDGVNDVSVGCRLENKDIPIHSRQNIISKLIKDNRGIINSYKINKFLFEPYSVIQRKLSRKRSPENSNYDCINDIKKANSVASHMVNNWYSAYLISKANEARFIAILQPYNNYSSSNYKKSTRPEYLYEKELYEKMYPLIKNKVKEKCLSDAGFCSTFVDGSKWINPKSNYFIDECHLIEEGNEVIADKIINLTNKYGRD